MAHQLWIKLRNAIFAETGYCLNVPRLHKDSTAYFATMDPRTNKPRKLDPILGCNGDVDDITVVHLRPYADEKAATNALWLMVGGRSVEDIDAEEAHRFIAVGLGRMVLDGCAFLKQDAATQRELMQTIYGAERVFEMLHGNRAARPDLLAMVEEALPRVAA